MIDHWAAANTAAESARRLFEAGDRSGAINRAYYAMFYGARAALASVDPKLIAVKSHSGLIQRFGKLIVDKQGLDKKLGRLFAQTEDLRTSSDYEGEEVEDTQIIATLDAMDEFLLAIRHFIGTAK